MADSIIEKLHNPPASCEELFFRLRSYPYAFFLDSALHNKYGRFSFLGCEPFLVLKSKNDVVRLEWSDGKTETTKANPFAVLKDILNRYKSDDRHSDLPFTSGAVGYFSYDLKDFVEELPNTAKDDLEMPDCVIGFYDVVMIYDNFKGEFYIASCGLPCEGTRRERKKNERLKEFKRRIIEAHPADDAYFINNPSCELKSNFTKAAYIKAIEKAKAYIKKGDIYQVNLSQRFYCPIGIDPARLYSKLRQASPAPFAAYLGFGGIAILSSSPERFLMKRANYIETRPIKGTRPRGENASLDILYERELTSSVKDHAEHIMIVDLERNDLGRICDYGTVKLAESPVIEKYSNVFHLVSTVAGRLKKGIEPIDCLLATFPCGSITGAPKIRAMEIIEELEPVKRSVYTGAIGYIGFNGDMDTSIVIRTLTVKAGKAYFSVGGGIVADSDPEAEYQETLDKAAGLTKALGVSLERETIPAGASIKL